jgi:cell division septation protein DedD
MPKPWIVKPLPLPVGDVTYEVQPIGYEDGLTLVSVGNGTSDDITGRLPRRAAVPALHGRDVAADARRPKCPYPVMVRAGLAAIQYQGALLNGLDTDAAIALAEPVWEAHLDPEALAALMTAATPSSQPETSKPSTSTASAGKTRSRASTSATTSPTATPRRAPKKTASPSVGKP